FLGFVPEIWKRRMQSPLFSGRGPKMGYTNLYEALRLHRGSIFAPAEPTPGMPCAVYFPGCGGALFYDRIGISSIMLLLRAGFAVAVPPRHLCCGYPLLAAGMDTAFEDNLAQNRQYLAAMLRNLAKQGFDCQYLVSSCGSCRDGLERLHLEEQFPALQRRDVGQLTLPLLDKAAILPDQGRGPEVLYHGACHCEWADVHKIKGQQQLVRAMSDFSGLKVSLNPGCCGESGMGAMTSPQIYNLLRSRKRARLAGAFEKGYDGPVVVGCPSCKIGIARSLMAMRDKRPVLHAAEWLAGLLDGEDRRQTFRKKVNETRGDIRIIEF
ncbi:(Fe-S)-binding protein, partial [uncultured Desulfovibrio sp.]